MTIKAAPQSVASEPEDREGNEQRFEHTMRRVLSISKEELAKREAAYKESRRAKKSHGAPR